jgi:hypothetical protein
MNFLSKNWETIVAILALIQPWVIVTWKKYIRNGTLEFDSTGRLEVGFNNYASTLGLNGTIRAIDKDYYVKEIFIELIKQKGKSKHTFKWAVLRDTNLNSTQQKLELPYGFIVSDAAPYRINVQLHDLAQQEELKKIVQTLESKWNTFVDIKFPLEKRVLADDKTYQSAMDDLHAEFKKSLVGDAHDKISKECYWESGKYAFSLTIITSKPTKKLVLNFDFELTDTEAESLKLNTFNIIDITLGQPEKTWFWAWPQHRIHDEN